MIYTKKTSSKIFYLDLLRDIAILSVIIYHIAGGVILAGVPTLRGNSIIPSISWIYHGFFYECSRFGVPLFLMLSGSLSLGYNYEFFSFLKKRMKRIIFPFLFWGLITFLLMLLFLYFKSSTFYMSFPAILYDLIQFLFGNNTYSLQFWFFWLIFQLYLVMPIINKWILNSDMHEIEYVLLIWASLCLIKYTLFFNLKIPFSEFIFSSGFLILGYYLRFTDNKLLNSRKFDFLLCISGIFCIMLFSSIFTLDDNLFQFNYNCIFPIMEVTGIFLFVKNSDLTFIKKFFKVPVESLAKHSYGIFLIHMFILVVLVNTLNLNLSLKFKGLIFFILVFGLSWLTMIVLSRIPYLNRLIGSK